MLAIYASAAAICLASLIAGRAFLVLLGRREWTWLSAPVGFGLLVVISQPLIRLPGRALTAAIVIGLLLVASLLYLRGRAGRVPAAQLLREGVPVAVILALAASIPFLLNGRVGVLGEGVYTNDQAAQLFWAEWLSEGVGREPRGVSFGYPLGPQSFAGTVSEATAATVEAAFNGLLLAIPILTGLVALSVLRELPPGRRTVAASLVGLPYLGASFLAQSAFKETAMALFVLALAVGLRDLARMGYGGRVAITAGLAVLALASVFTFSLPGVAWFAAAIPIWFALEIWAGHIPLSVSRGVAILRRVWPAVLAVAVVLAALGATQAGVLSAFFDRLEAVQESTGRLFSSVSPREALGIWPQGDFRLNVAGTAKAWAATALALAAAALAAWWWVRRRDLAVPATLAGAVLIYAAARVGAGIHVEAKALAVMAPLLMLFVTAALFAPGRSLAAYVLGAAFAVAATGSTLIALRAAPVGTSNHVGELAELRSDVRGSDVLFLAADRFAPYRLRGATVESPGGYVPSRRTPSREGKRWEQGRAIDFDTVPPEQLDRVRYAITTNAPYQSQPPASFRPVRQTRSYTLWQRTGPTERREILDGENGKPENVAGSVLDCSTPEGAALSRTGGIAAVIPAPVVGGPGEWRPSNSFAPGGSASQSLDLGPGRWKLSIQYHSPIGLVLEGPGLRRELPASLEGMFAFAPGLGPYWPAGEVEIEGSGEARFAVRAKRAPWAARLLDAERFSWVGAIAATRPGESRATPLAGACGRYVDWYIVEGQ